MNYFIWINNEAVPVSESVYRAYWQGARKERYFAESDIHNHVFSYDALDTDEMNGGDLFSRNSDVPVDDQVIRNLETEQLYDAMKKLSSEEYHIIDKLYFCGTSLRRLSQETGIPLSTLHGKHRKILQKLRCCMEPAAANSAGK